MTIVEAFRRDDLRVLDRLIDDELRPDERRELLAALDDEPGAWRRCALAFLEAQTWRRQLSHKAIEPSAAHGVNLQTPRKSRGGVWSTCLAVAASLLLAFGLGTRFPLPGLSPEAQPPTLAQSKNLPTQPEPQTESAAADPAAPDSEPWQTVTLTDSADPQDEIELRVVEGGEDDQEWLANQQSAVPVEWLQQFEQAGWEVKHRQRLLPIELSDGRRLVVPIEEVDFHFPETIPY